MKDNNIHFTTQEKFNLSWNISFTEDMMDYLVDYLEYGKYEDWEGLTYKDWFEFAEGIKDKKLLSEEYPGCLFSATEIVRDFLKWYFMCEEPDKLRITGYSHRFFDAEFEEK